MASVSRAMRSRSLDPVFSSGVFMALKSGELAADAIHRGLGCGSGHGLDVR